MKNEKRIYVVVPKEVVTQKRLLMSCGRLMAQVAHVVSKLKLRQKLDADDEYTTIVLAVKDDSALMKRYNKFRRYVKQHNKQAPYELFWDTNSEFYGDYIVPTAFATMITKRAGKHFKDLKLYDC